MIRSELVQKLCQDFPDLTQREVETVVSAVFNSITDQLAHGGDHKRCRGGDDGQKDGFKHDQAPFDAVLRARSKTRRTL